MCDFWPTESLWANVKARLTKKVSKSKAWKGGVGTRRGREGAKGGDRGLLDLKCDCAPHVGGLLDLKCFTFRVCLPLGSAAFVFSALKPLSLSTSIRLRTHSLASGFSLGRKTRKYKAVMKSWAAFVRPVITGTPKRTLCNVYKGIPARRDRIIAANGGAIAQ